MNIQSTQAHWNDIIQEAADIVLFEPGLTGLEEQVSGLATGTELSKSWLTTVESWLKQSAAISALALRLNELAGIYYSLGELAAAERICHAAFLFAQTVHGSEHENTVLISGNLTKLKDLKTVDNPIKPDLPKLRSFTGRKHQER
ncbi:MAG: tetratricopeptide repeat protein [Candidatus Obscuribacter sp.]|nr:tetratricopeptide repeat protein [Candidatus Obscuribacter sp.]MBK9276577.1 tetratricopeptide repeat protein [Candidatus Obscuribacter sp.]